MILGEVVLIFGSEFHHPASLVGITQGSEDLACDAEVGMVHVGPLFRLRQRERESAKVFGGHIGSLAGTLAQWKTPVRILRTRLASYDDRRDSICLDCELGTPHEGGDRLPAMTEGKSTVPALYLVGTPIGNLEDIALRAIRVLKEVDVIACEDTRQTQKLLNHYAIATRTTSYHEHNEMTRSAELVKEMQEGASVALVSDAGMPGISDPGYRLITLAIRHHLPVIPVPGPSAFLAALAASGLPTDSFRFGGFLPARQGERRVVLDSLRNSSVTDVFYEAPHRLLETLGDVVELLGSSRQIVVAREVTKIHEEFVRGAAAEVMERLKSRVLIKGEITLLIGKAEPTESVRESSASVRQRVAQLMAEEQIDEKAALKKLAKERGVSKSEIYREMQRQK